MQPEQKTHHTASSDVLSSSKNTHTQHKHTISSDSIMLLLAELRLDKQPVAWFAVHGTAVWKCKALPIA